MELWKQLLSDDVGIASLVVIAVTTVIVCTLVGIVYKRSQDSSRK